MKEMILTKELKKFFLKCIELMYYMWNKRYKIAIPIIIVVFGVQYLVVSYLTYIVVASVIHDTTVFSLQNSFFAIGSVLAIIVVMNAFSKNCNYFKFILEHVYLRRMVKPLGLGAFLRIVISSFFIKVVYSICVPIIYKIGALFEMNKIELLIFEMITVFAFAYFVLTDSIIESYRRYRAKSIASFLTMIMTAILYVAELTNGNGRADDVYGIIIFCLGQVALLESAISNYREMYDTLREKYVQELNCYFTSVEREFDERCCRVQNEFSDAIECAKLWRIIWSDLPKKKKIYFWILLVIGILLSVGLAIISNKLSAIIH